MDSTQPLANKETTKMSVGDHPFGAFFGAVGIGILVGYAISNRPHETTREPIAVSNGHNGNGHNGHSKSSVLSMATGTAAGLATSGVASALTQLFDEEIKGALGAALGAIWGETRHLVPEGIAQPVDRLFDRVNRKLAGPSFLRTTVASRQ